MELDDYVEMGLKCAILFSAIWAIFVTVYSIIILGGLICT